MPCGYFDHDAVEERLHEDLDKLTIMLCELCEAYENDTTTGTVMPTHIRKWWKQHQADDIERKKIEKEELERELHDMEHEVKQLKKKIKTQKL